MTDKPKPGPQKPEDDQETQDTKQGYEIPIPTRGDFFGNLKKIIKPEK